MAGFGNVTVDQRDRNVLLTPGSFYADPLGQTVYCMKAEPQVRTEVQYVERPSWWIEPVVSAASGLLFVAWLIVIGINRPRRLPDRVDRISPGTPLYEVKLPNKTEDR